MFGFSNRINANWFGQTSTVVWREPFETESYSKCQAIQVCFSKTPPSLSDLRVGTDRIPYVSEAKVQRLWLQSDLKWSVHIQKLLEKANKKMFSLRTLKRFGFGPSELSAVYTSYIDLFLNMQMLFGILISPVAWQNWIHSKESM